MSALVWSLWRLIIIAQQMEQPVSRHLICRGGLINNYSTLAQDKPSDSITQSQFGPSGWSRSLFVLNRLNTLVSPSNFCETLSAPSSALEHKVSSINQRDKATYEVKINVYEVNWLATSFYD